MSKGYVVVNEYSGNHLTLLKRPNALWPSIPAGGVLLFTPKTMTVFGSRSEAKRAIERTRAYHRDRVKSPPNSLADAEYFIVRLVPSAS